MKESWAAADGPIGPAMKLQAFPESTAIAAGITGKARMDIRMAFGIWKKSTEMAVEARGEKMMRS